MEHKTLIELLLHANLKVDGVYKASIEPGSKAIDQRTLNGVCGIVIPISGMANYEIEGQVYELAKGKIFFAGSNMPINKIVLGASDWSYYLIHYKPITSDGVESQLMQSHFELQICQKNAVNMINQSEWLLRLQDEPTVMNRLKSRNYLQRMIQQLIEFAMCFGMDSAQMKVTEIMNLIHEKYHTQLSNEGLAEFVAWDMKKMHYEFTKIVGETPKHYLIQHRLNKAKTLLASSTLTVNEISQLVGYEDSFHFSRMFKKYTGVSPSKYREGFEKIT